MDFYSERCYLYAIVSRMHSKHKGDRDNLYAWVADGIYGVAAGISSREHMAYLAEHAETAIARQGYAKSVRFLAQVQKMPFQDRIR